MAGQAAVSTHFHCPASRRGWPLYFATRSKSGAQSSKLRRVLRKRCGLVEAGIRVTPAPVAPPPKKQYFWQVKFPETPEEVTWWQALLVIAGIMFVYMIMPRIAFLAGRGAVWVLVKLGI